MILGLRLHFGICPKGGVEGRLLCTTKLIIGTATHRLVLTGSMSSGFISGGTADQPLERDDEWRKAQQEIEDRRRQKEQERRQGGEKSLYEILQNNKGGY